MKFSLLALVAGASLHSIAAFSVCRQTLLSSSSARRTSCALPMSDDDDWYSDYDPNAYTQYNNESRNNNGYSETRNDNRRPRDRFSSGGGHDYTRDTSRDCSNVDEDAVNNLLAERVRAKKQRDFDKADEIRDQLLSEHAVGVYDRERTWRTGCSSSGSGMKRGGGGTRFGDNKRGGRGPQRDRDFGPNGHDYEESAGAGPNISSLSDDEIHSIIAERLQAKINRNFDTADRLQYKLVGAGVYVHDGMKEWRADSVPFGDLQGQGGRPGKSNRNRPYEKSEYSVDVEGTAEDEIIELVEERSMCKATRDYPNADRIRDELIDKFDVHIDDRLREWSVGGNFGEEQNKHRALSETMSSRGYTKSENSGDLPSVEDEEYVQAKVDERQEAKKVRDYDTADAIRDELLEEFDVAIDDKLRKWSVGGVFGEAYPKRFGGYSRRGGGDLSDDDVATINSLIIKRTKAKKERDFDVADDIRDELRETFQVTVDDKNREWRVVSDDYVQSPLGSGASFSEEEIAIIQSKVEERATMKRERDYEAADALRDELRDQFSVLIDDRTKEWKRVEDDGFEADKFVADASASQSSAFKRKEMDDELDDALSAILESDPYEEPKVSAPVELNGGAEFATVDEVIPSLSRDDLMSRTVVDLKEMLREADKPVSGNKAELVDRLLS